MYLYKHPTNYTEPVALIYVLNFLHILYLDRKMKVSGAKTDSEGNNRKPSIDFCCGNDTFCVQASRNRGRIFKCERFPVLPREYIRKLPSRTIMSPRWKTSHKGNIYVRRRLDYIS